MSDRAAPAQSLLGLSGITKRFGNFTALDAVDFKVGAGEIVGLLGENGAGKSTLMNVVGGVLPPTAGSLNWNGSPVHFASPRDATRLGIGVVHQHFMLVPIFTVAENVALHAPHAGAVYNAKEWERRVEEWANSLGWRIEASRLVEQLSVGERQRVEILKALFVNSDGSKGEMATRLLLLDEPTANLTPPEVDELFTVLRRLRERGCGIVFVSHKLKEVLALCDRIMVLRHGRMVGERNANKTNVEELATLMVGRELGSTAIAEEGHQSRQISQQSTPSRLEIKNLSCGILQNISLTVGAGEIVGLAGVDGNGQHELVEALSGLSKPEAGTIIVSNENSELAQAITVIPPDRQHVGLVLPFDVAENIMLHPALRAQFKRRLGFDWKSARARAREMMQQFDVRAPATAERTITENLSGGNQQKVVIARALALPHAVVVAADPTRGLDVGASEFVHEQLRRAAASGAGVLLISTDLDEILHLSDRIGVLYEGRLLPHGDLLPASVEREAIGALMGGAVSV
jgi:simple sugar transport system ATP-binding protein